MEAIIQMRDELHRHTQEIEMRLEQKLSESIVQMSVLINTEALVVPCDKTASMKMMDETNDDSQRQSHMNRIIVQSNNSLPPQQRCVSIGNDDRLRKEDSDWEDSSFIDGGWAPTALTAIDKSNRRGRKKRKGQSYN